MNVQLAFGLSVAFSVIAWSVVGASYLWPLLRERSRADALRPLLVLHAFRFIGLSFLVPGVVAPDLPMAFARGAAYGDLMSATLALLALATLRSRLGLAFAWVFNVCGTIDVLNGFYEANASGLAATQFGAAFYIPTVIVPLLLVTHIIAFRILLKPDRIAESSRISVAHRHLVDPKRVPAKN
jgi:hypothetical protein